MPIKIFVGNLSDTTTTYELQPLFDNYGKVTECDVLRNFGFVHMESEEEANEAIRHLNGFNLHGQNIRVEKSTGKGNTEGFRRGMRGGGMRGGGMRGRGGPGRGGPMPYGRYPPPPPPHPDYDRYDPYARDPYRDPYYAERYARLPPPPGEYPRERLHPYGDPRDRLAHRERYLPYHLEDRRLAAYERARALDHPPGDPYYRERSPLRRPPPEYYERPPPEYHPRESPGEHEPNGYPPYRRPALDDRGYGEPHMPPKPVPKPVQYPPSRKYDSQAKLQTGPIFF